MRLVAARFRCRAVRSIRHRAHRGGTVPAEVKLVRNRGRVIGREDVRVVGNRVRAIGPEISQVPVTGQEAAR
jgi:hypothetical protein